MMQLIKPFIIITILIIGTLLVPVGSSNEKTTVSFVVGPYTQQSQTDSVTVLWMTKTLTRHDEVHWGKSPELGNVTIEKNICAKIFHTVKIKGLTTGIKHYYTVVSDGTECPQYTFWTAFNRNDIIPFVVYGDSRGGWDAWGSSLIVSQAIEKEQPAFVLNTGDLVDNGRNLNDWFDFFTASPFIHNSTLYPVLGNHENNGYLYFSFFSLPFNEHWYSFENGPIHFIGLDSNTCYRFRIGQYLWLLHDLHTNNLPYTIVYFHQPVYSSGNHGNTTVLQKIWAPIFERFHVDIVFNGHDHDYERSIVNDVTYIVTGGGGAPLYDVGQSSWTIYSEKTFHYCLLTVNSSKLTFEAKKPDGFVFDSFFLTR